MKPCIDHAARLAVAITFAAGGVVAASSFALAGTTPAHASHSLAPIPASELRVGEAPDPAITRHC